MTNHDEPQVDVLVAGSGPVGLMAAGELARRGVSVRIVDQAPQRSPQSRALVVHARTLEIMDLAGLADTFVERGYPAPGLNIGLGGSDHDVCVDMRVLDTRFPFMLVLPQRETEQILADRLASYGVETEWHCGVVGVDQSDTEVVATVRTDTGDQQRIRARYLIGCDGAHSAVRQLVRIPMEGKQHSELVLIGDVKVDATFMRSRITNFTGPRGFVSILPFLGEYVRVFAVDFAQQDHDRSDELGLRELQDAVDAIAPQRISLSDPTWLTRYNAPSRKARTTRAGRVFLAGDAAHAHSAAGGQGMNTGLQDAANLGWKLTMVLRGQADDTLLDTFAAERQAVHDAVLRQTDRMFRTFVVRNPVLKAVRGVAARMLVPRAPIQRRLAEELSGLAVGYRQSARVRSALDAPRGLRAGDRVPDVDLWAPQRPVTRLYEVLRDPRYTLLAYATSDRVTQDRAALADLMHRMRDFATVRPAVVLDEGVLDQVEDAVDVFVDVTGKFAAKFGAVHGSVLLIRPDGYLALHHVGFDPHTVVATSQLVVTTRERMIPR
ncbi:MAG: FAD-dependent monooxygenase [Actinomycetota bacterium]|nr:FAD-dependent monooxygenase [Actinomycetota bacterium]